VIIFVQEKLVASTGPQPVRSKFVIDNEVIGQVNSVIYLGKLIYY